MAKTFYEPDEKGRMRITESKGSKKPIKLAKGFVKKIEDLPFVSEKEINKAINIIDKSSNSRSESRRRKSNFLNDVTGRGFL